MFELHLTVEPAGADAVTAGYRCPCGCTPATTYQRGDRVATEGCCCGNEFAVGPEAMSHVHPQARYEIQTDSLMAPWGERLPVAWAIGPSTHHETEGGGHHDHSSDAAGVIDPVCGMVVEPDASRAKGHETRHRDVEYFFCGKGCKLEFDDDPEHYLDPSYVPSM